jgi:hypothetical protein
MAKTKIKRCLFIGLGGTGMTALLHTKKRFLETYGEIPPMIRFLGVDTDGGAYKKFLTTIDGRTVELTNDEKLPIQVEDPMAIYEHNNDKFTWLPVRNTGALKSITAGAGQVRTNGRFALTVNRDYAKSRLEEAIANLTNATIHDNPKYESLDDSHVEVHMVFSICGGTGCGTFINMAGLVREVQPKCKLTGYAVLPDVFKLMSQSGMALVGPNAYGALMDLDYLMSLKGSSVTLQYLKEPYQIEGRPFNAVFLVDNKTRSGDTYKTVDSLAEMISLGLITSAGALSNASASVSDNLEKRIADGSYDIEDKTAWVSGMGACEVIYRGGRLGEVYSTKAALRLIDGLINSDADANMAANSWIDKPEVNIRENEGNDHLIDTIMDAKPKFAFEIENEKNVESEIASYRIRTKETEESLQKVRKSISERLQTNLDKLVKNTLDTKGGGGIGLTEKVLDSIIAQVNIFAREMETEKKELSENLPRLEQNVKADIENLNDASKKWTFFGMINRGVNDAKDDVSSDVNQLVRQEREIQRRSIASAIFAELLGMLKKSKDDVSAIKSAANAAYGLLNGRLNDLQNPAHNSESKSRLFQIDLTDKTVTNIELKPEEGEVTEFLKVLSGDGKIFSLFIQSAESVVNALLAYTDKLDTVKKFKERSIDEVINALSDTEFQNLLDLIKDKSQILARYDRRGKFSSDKPYDAYYIGVPEKGKSRLEKDDAFKKTITENPDVTFTSIGMHDRIIAYRVTGVYPAYTQASIMRYEEEYKKNQGFETRPSCHFDDDMLRRMKRENWNLMYKEANEDDILRIWVMGFIFGLIRNEGESYEYKSVKKGNPLDDHWVSLGTKYRDDAYENFKKERPVDEFTKFFEDEKNAKGKEKMAQFIAKAKSRYYDLETGEGLSGVNIKASDLKMKEYQKIGELVIKELNLVEKLKL